VDLGGVTGNRGNSQETMRYAVPAQSPIVGCVQEFIASRKQEMFPLCIHESIFTAVPNYMSIMVRTENHVG